MLTLALAALLQSPPMPDMADVLREVDRLRIQVAALDAGLRARDETLEAMARDVATLRAQGKPEPASAVVAAAFLAGPPPSSDVGGVAKTAVFAPRVRVETTGFHDAVAIHVRRVTARDVVTVGRAEVPRDEAGTDVPIDENGALYVAEWSTSEGHTYAITLVDGATGLPAATAQVRDRQVQGRFLFVGYRLD